MEGWDTLNLLYTNLKFPENNAMDIIYEIIQPDRLITLVYNSVNMVLENLNSILTYF